MKDYVREFIKAIAPEAPDLYIASFDERRALTDATEIITTLRLDLGGARIQIEALESRVAYLQQSLLDMGRGQPLVISAPVGASEVERLSLWQRFAVHGGPQGSFMLYPGFRDALRELLPELPARGTSE